MTEMKKTIRVFQSEDDERLFWSMYDSTEYLDWNAATARRLPNLKATVRTISLRLPNAR